MPRCLECGCLVSVHVAECPECGARHSGELTQQETEANDWGDVDADRPSVREFHGRGIPVARFANGAEAGFFANELEGATGIPVRLVVQDDFDAMRNAWGSTFVLIVPEDEAHRAAEFLHNLLNRVEDEWAGESEGEGGDYAAVPSARVPWVSLLLTIAAGSFAYWGVHHLDVRPRAPALMHRGHPEDEVWEALADPSTPWMQKLDNGPGTRLMFIERRENRAVIAEDRDGDGIYERRFQYRLRAAGN